MEQAQEDLKAHLMATSEEFRQVAAQHAEFHKKLEALEAKPRLNADLEVNLPALIADLEAQMREAATNLDFESAARIRDELFEVKAKAGRQESSRGSLAGLHG